MKKRVYVDLHVLQNVPPSCLNRDDTGSPKSAVYGGARRARVSSQAWKRAMRLMFRDRFDASELGIRTRLVFDGIAEEIQAQKPELASEEAIKMAQKIWKATEVKASKTKGKENQLGALFFISAQQAKNLALLALGDADVNEKEVLKTLNANQAVDVALFGRMVADNPELNCDASAQVAHAISTHRVENEYDFFTAVDDLAPEDNMGAGHMGTVEYNAATLYRYASLAAHNLFDQIGNNAELFAKTVGEFVRAFVCSMPTGKQNTFAAHTVPDAVLAVVRADRPLSLAGAFEKPVRSEEGFLSASARELEKYARDVYDAGFCQLPTKAYIVGRYLDNLGERLPLEALIEKLSAEVTSMLP